MPISGEPRTIDYFISSYNDLRNPKIIDRIAIPEQESPDAICTLEDQRLVALELTSAFPPKRIERYPHKRTSANLSPLIRILHRKFLNHFKDEEIDEVLLLVNIRKLLQQE